jgi:hypothetical protein
MSALLPRGSRPSTARRKEAWCLDPCLRRGLAVPVHGAAGGERALAALCPATRDGSQHRLLGSVRSDELSVLFLLTRRGACRLNYVCAGGADDRSDADRDRQARKPAWMRKSDRVEPEMVGGCAPSRSATSSGLLRRGRHRERHPSECKSLSAVGGGTGRVVYRPDSGEGTQDDD